MWSLSKGATVHHGQITPRQRRQGLDQQLAHEWIVGGIVPLYNTTITTCIRT